MKNFTLLFVIVTMLIGNLTAQTVQYSEDFETAPYDVVTTTTGITNWGLNSTYYSQGANSYYSVVEQDDSLIMTTTTIDCSGNNFVSLEFDHICKIFTLDAAEILVSDDNGNTWTQLTSSHYLGNSQFNVQGNKFTGSSYPIDWDAGQPVTMSNTWWKTESFDISTIAANKNQVKIRFILRDANGGGASSYVGWFVDNIKVTVAIDELIPPAITLVSYPHDTVYNAGPFTVKADVTDASGVDSVKLTYTHNLNAPVTVQMTYLSGNSYTATIPSIVLDDSVCYYIYAVDSSIVRNTTIEPSSGCMKFYYKLSPPPPGCSSPISSYPFFENFDSSPSSFPSNWNLQTAGSTSFVWQPNSGSTGTGNTGPTGDHTSGAGVYAYTESSYGTTGDSTILITPCMDIRTLAAPKLKFWYHMYGSSMGTLAVDIFYGNGYIHDVWTMTGDQGDNWKEAVVDLTPYKSITEIRFRGLKGTSIYSDFAIDDILVYDPPSDDAGIASIDAPSSPGATGVQNIEVSLENGGSQSLTSADIYWEVGGIAQTTYNWAGTLPAGDTIHNLIIGTYNFLIGPANIKAWSSNPNTSLDTYPINDTASKSVMVCGGGLSGTYTIGGSTPDYNTITEAVDAIINCGISAAVTFDIRPGTYTEQLRIPSILGSSSTNTITFQSETGDSSDVMITYAASSINNYIIQLDSAEYVTFQNVSFESTNASYGSVIELKGTATHNTISNCRILSNGTSGNNKCIYSKASNVNYNTFSNNYMKYGYSGIYLHSVSTVSIAYGNQIINNTIDSIYYYGMYLYGQDSVKVKNNSITNSNGAGSIGTGTIYGIYTYYCDNDIEISGNNLTLASTSSNYGIYLYYTNGSIGNPNRIYNNMIALNQNNTGTSQPIRMYYSNYNDIYYNTLYSNGMATTSSNSCIYMYGSSTTSSANNNFKNNIFYSKNSGYTIYCSTATYCLNTVFDNNCHFTNGATMAYWNGNRIDLAAWQSAGFGANSISVDPNFLNLPDLHCKSPIINGTANPILSYDVDIDGDARNATTPDMGADEFDPPLVDAAITELVNPTAPCDGSVENINVRLASYGQNTLNSVTINWSINGAPQTAFNFGGTLNTNEDTVLTIGTYTFNSGTLYNIKVYSSNPNSTVDEDNLNDTLLVSGIETAMSGGIYTINPALPISATNYQTFNGAVTDLVNNGICSSIVFNVASGTYNEQIGIEEIRGTSPSVTVTFQSATGDSSDVVVAYSPTLSTDNYTLAFDKASYITFKNMTFSSGGVTYGRIVYFQNEANNINIENCELKGSGINSASTNYTGVFTLSNSNCNNLTIKNNYIHGVAYAFYIYTGQSNIIENNNTSSYYYGIYAYYQNDIMIKNNTIAFSTPAYSTNYGIRNYQSNSFEITGNKLSFNGANSNYGMYLYYANNGLIANNFISQTGALTSTNRMIYLSSYCADLTFAHNSVLIEATSSSTSSVCFYNGSSTNTNLNVINNVFANTGGSGYAYYNISTTSVDTSDYNLYYTTGSLFAYWGGAQANLSALQSSNGKDQYSLSSNPNFIANTNLHIANSAAGDAGLALSYVNTDIDGEVRSATTPDIGADEFEPPFVDAGVFAVLSPSGMLNTGINIPFRIAFKNLGLNNITNINITYVLNGGAPVSQAWAGTLAYGDTTSLIIANDQLIGGTNSIKAYTTLSGDNFAYNDTLIAKCFGLYPLKLYFNDFETVTDDWVPAVNSVLWDLGTPAMTTLNYAYSGNNVWATRLTGAYFNNRTEYLYSPKFSFLLLNNLQIGFYNWMVTEGGVDGGYLEYSKDDGTTWLRVGYTGDPNGFNWYDGNAAATGGYCWGYDTEEWEASVYDFSNELPIYPQVQFRLVFESSPANTADGWAVDDFGIYVPKVGKDASAISINTPTGILVPGTSHTVSITIHNPGMDTLYSIPVSYQAINTGMPPMGGTWTGTLLPDSTANYTFTIPFNVPGIASFELCAFTKLSLDYHAFNDTTCQTVETTLGLAEGDISGTNLWQNSPNPASKFTTITYQIPQQGDVRLEIINTLGQTMNSLEIPEQISGKHSLEMDVSTLRSGIYYIRMIYNNQSLSTKMIITR
jgi:MAM domain, meprin/A5/mu/Secretion system C-terminal sorting domain/Right handed beta helix region